MILLLESRLICHLVFLITILLFQVTSSSYSINFEEIFKQRLKGNKVDTCPCIILPNHSKCINYDPRYLAVTLEEAVLSFHDTTYHEVAPPPTSDEITKFQCQTEECLQCVGIMNNILYYRKIINSKHSLRFNFHIPSDEELNPVKCKKYRMTADIPLITPVKSLIEEVKPLIEKAKQFLKAPNKSDLLRSKFFLTRRKNNLLQNITSTITPPSRPPTLHTRPPYIIRDSQVRIGQVQHPVNVMPPTTSLNPIKNVTTFVSNVKSKITIFNRPTTTTTVILKTTTTIRAPTPTTTTTRTTPITTIQKQITDQDNYNVNPPQVSKFQTLDELVKLKIERSVPPISFHSSMEPMFPPNRPHMYASTTLQQVPTKNTLPQPALGIRHKISCTPRGQPTTGTSTFINLCSFCWSWRRLPDGYFPKIINELVCDTDNHCLSGWGTCEQLHRSVDVFRQEPNGEWKQVSLQIASCCVCKVQAGSDIHGLVMG